MNDDENPRLGESPSDNKFIDEITMKLLSNHSGYAKYLSKTDESKHEEIQQFKIDCNSFLIKNFSFSLFKSLLITSFIFFIFYAYLSLAIVML